MTTKEKYEKSVMKTYKQQEMVLVKGDNATCFDENKKKYIDFGSGIGVNSLGYSNPDWVEAVSKQASTLQHVSNLYYSQPMADLSETLCQITGYSRVFLGNSGAEANEGSIKVARKYSSDKYGENRNKILSLHNSFHGRTITTLSATGQSAMHQHFFPFNDGFDFAMANDFKDVKSKLEQGGFCAVLFEFVQGEGGVVPLDVNFVKELFAYCEEHDILTIADEVQTGVGRTGKFLACEHFGVKPNIVSLAKGLGGGLPIGAVLTDSKTQDVLAYSDHGTTFGGNLVACAGANVVLSQVGQSDFLLEVTKKSEYLREKLSKIEEIASVDGLGLMLGLQLKTKKAVELVPKAIEKGLIPLTAKEKIRLLPPLTISYEELDEGLAILQEILTN